MAGRTSESKDKDNALKEQMPNGEEQKSSTSLMDSDFISLDDLVYAPLHALAESNLRLTEHVVDAIKSMGSIQQDGQEEIIHLDNMNLAYEQVRQEGDGYSIDDLQLQVPLLSIVPITNLNVEKAQIEFATEVHSHIDKEGNVKINGRICSPEPRDSDFLPRVSYHMEIKSTPATEGVMRITDLLNSNQLAKQIDTTPITPDGNTGSEEQKAVRQKIAKLQGEIKRLKALYEKIRDTITEQEKLYEICKDNKENALYQVDKTKYIDKQMEIARKIMRAQEEIITLEIAGELERETDEQ